MIKPNYYLKEFKGKVYECWDIINIFICDLPVTEAACMYNILKYLWRYRGKNGDQDLEKAQTQLAKLRELYGEVNNDNT